jgi:hypothetical protein
MYLYKKSNDSTTYKSPGASFGGGPYYVALDTKKQNISKETVVGSKTSLVFEDNISKNIKISLKDNKIVFSFNGYVRSFDYNGSDKILLATRQLTSLAPSFENVNKYFALCSSLN